MAVFPVTTSTLSAKELGALIKDKYPLHGNFDCKLFRTGMNHTYFLLVNETKYVLRVYSHNWRSKSEIIEELELLILLNKNDLGVSFPIPDSNGEYIQEINAPEGIRYVVLFSFAEGEKNRFLNEENCFAIGALIAKIHKLTENKVIDRISYNQKSLLELPYNYLKPFFSEEISEMEFIKNIGDYYQDNDFENLQKGSVHLDIWYDNMAVTDKGDITIFDFDFCGNGPQVLDVGYFCFQLFHIETEKEVYEQKKKQFLEGYQSIKRLSENELNFIPKAGLAVLVFYLGVQAKRFDWSNIFLSENYLKMFYIGRLKSWIAYNKIEKTIAV